VFPEPGEQDAFRDVRGAAVVFIGQDLDRLFQLWENLCSKEFAFLRTFSHIRIID